jgi:ribosomal protein S4E
MPKARNRVYGLDILSWKRYRSLNSNSSTLTMTTNAIERQKMQARTYPKRLIARKGDAQLITHHGEVYLYPDALSTNALFVCRLEMFHQAVENLVEDGWTIVEGK